MAKNSIDWWLTTEDLPDVKNAVRVEGDDRIIIDYTENNSEPFARLNARWKQILQEIDQEFVAADVRRLKLNGSQSLLTSAATRIKTGYFETEMPMHSLGHQVGTCKFGEDPATSVLDLNCRAHDVDNLYVVEGSFLVSSGAVNPTLTIIANALRVGDHLLARLAGSDAKMQQHNGTFKKAVMPEMVMA